MLHLSNLLSCLLLEIIQVIFPTTPMLVSVPTIIPAEVALARADAIMVAMHETHPTNLFPRDLPLSFLDLSFHYLRVTHFARRLSLPMHHGLPHLLCGLPPFLAHFFCSLAQFAVSLCELTWVGLSASFHQSPSILGPRPHSQPQLMGLLPLGLYLLGYGIDVWVIQVPLFTNHFVIVNLFHV